MPMKQLKNLTIATSGDLGDNVTNEQLKRWITAHSGRWVPSVDSSVTHLVCSKAHWKSQFHTVTTARELGRIKIVSYDWLEDSLQNPTKKPVQQYLWTTIENSDKALKMERQRNEKKPKSRNVKSGKKAKQIANDLFSAESTKNVNQTNDRGNDALMAGDLLLAHLEETTKKRRAAEQLGGKGAKKSKLGDSSNKVQPIQLKSPYYVPVPEGFDIHRGPDGYEYSLTVSRVDIRNNSNDRFLLRIYETNQQAVDGPKDHTNKAANEEVNTNTGEETGGEDTGEDDCGIEGKTKTIADGEAGDYPNSFALHARYSNGNKEPVTMVYCEAIYTFGEALNHWKELCYGLTGQKWPDRVSTALVSADPERPKLNLKSGMPDEENIIKKPFAYPKDLLSKMSAETLAAV